jgi:hypothetical protein
VAYKAKGIALTLLTKGANKNTLNKTGLTPLSLATSASQDDASYYEIRNFLAEW